MIYIDLSWHSLPILSNRLYFPSLFLFKLKLRAGSRIHSTPLLCSAISIHNPSPWTQNDLATWTWVPLASVHTSNLAKLLSFKSLLSPTRFRMLRLEASLPRSLGSPNAQFKFGSRTAVLRHASSMLEAAGTRYPLLCPVWEQAGLNRLGVSVIRLLSAPWWLLNGFKRCTIKAKTLGAGHAQPLPE